MKITITKENINNLEKLLLSGKNEALENTIEKFDKYNFSHPAVQMIYAASKSMKPNSSIKDKKIAFDIYLNYFKKNNKFVKALYNACSLSFEINEYSNLLLVLKDYIKNNPYDGKIFEALYKIYNHLVEIDISIYYLKIITKKEPFNYNAWSALIFSLNYKSKTNQKEYLKNCSNFEKNIKKYSKFNEKIKNKKKIRLAFITPFFDGNSIDGFLRGLLKNINNKIFQSISFNLNSSDEKSDHLKNYFDEWYHVYNYNDEDLINYIRNKEIDIIIDLAGYGPNNRLTIFKNRVAHLQMLWLGYCNSLGLKEIDYILTDKNLIKSNENNDYTEKPLYLKNIWNCHEKISEKIAVNDLPFYKEKIFTFGSFNNFSKINKEVIKVWSKILLETNSRLILKSSLKISAEKIENLKNKFPKKKISNEKIIFYSGQEKKEDHLKKYHEIDICLDTFPYPGVTTTFEAIWMGVPVLTLKGNNFVSRCGESINKNLKLEKFLANSKSDYISKAKKISKDFSYLSKLRSELREMAILSPLFDTKDFAADFGEKLEQVWKDYCRNSKKIN